MLTEFKEIANQEDEDVIPDEISEQSMVDMDKVWEVMSELGVGPKEIGSEVKEFMEYLVFRQSDSLTQMDYTKFFEIFEEDYLLEDSPYED